MYTYDLAQGSETFIVRLESAALQSKQKQHVLFRMVDDNQTNRTTLSKNEEEQSYVNILISKRSKTPT